MRKTALVLLLCLLAGLLSGCGSVYKADYYHETDYAFPEQPQGDPSPQDKVTVADAAALRRELLDMVYAGQSDRRIAFDPGYEGDPRADLEAVCGTMHREDALWAYCVQNARFEVSHIVTHDEAEVWIEYAASALPVGEVLQLNYAAGLEKTLRAAMESDCRRLVILIGNSRYSADTMADLVRTVYRADPDCAAVEPKADVYMYSGAGRQRLYDIELDYRLDDETLRQRRAELAAFDSISLIGADRSSGMRALALASYLTDNCTLTEFSGHSSAWDALIAGEADSEGLALAYVILCGQQGIPCQLVQGQRERQEHFWNIIELDGEHYHVDLSACIRDGIGNGFLLNDESMWTSYRWDTSSYAICAGGLDYWTLTGLDRTPAQPEEQPEPAEEMAEPTEEPEETTEPAGEPEEPPEPTEEPAPSEEPTDSGEP